MNAINPIFKGRFSRFSMIVMSGAVLSLAVSAITYQHYAANNRHQFSALDKNKIMANYFKMPFSFEVNQGQVDNQVKYFSHGLGYNLFFTNDELVFAFPTITSGTTKVNNESSITNNSQAVTFQVMRAKFVGANTNVVVNGSDKLITKSNYFIGNDPKQWHTDVSNYGKVNYKNLYRGIDATFYGNQQRFEYDINIAPNADPNLVRLSFSGTKNLNINKQGDLILNVSPANFVSMHKPIVYQQFDGVKHDVDGNFVILADNQIGFKIGSYDKTKPLVIDPILSYSTYLGGTLASFGANMGFAIAADSSRNSYVTGLTSSVAFPTANPEQSTIEGAVDAFVSKINETGTGLIYSTYLGGGGGYDANTIPDHPGISYARGIVVDSANNAYITGRTSSVNFPVTSGAFQTTFDGEVDAFVTKINQDGNALVYSTFLGDQGYAKEHDREKRHHRDGYTAGRGITVDGAGNAYIVGSTNSVNLSTSWFPASPNAFKTSMEEGDPLDAFVTKLNPNGTNIIYSTYLGGSKYDHGNGIAVDSSGKIYVTGYTHSGGDWLKRGPFPTTAGAYQKVLAGWIDGFVTEIDPSKSGLKGLVYSTFLGGAKSDFGLGIALDSSNNIYVTGLTSSPTDFPHTAGAYQTAGGFTTEKGANAFFSKIDPTASGVNSLIYSTYLGGKFFAAGRAIAVDSEGSAYIVGGTSGDVEDTNGAFPTTPDAFQGDFRGGSGPKIIARDAFFAKITPSNGGISDLLYSTFLGSSLNDTAYGVALDSVAISNPGTYITGQTTIASLGKFGAEGDDFPITTNSVDESHDSSIFGTKQTQKSDFKIGILELDGFVAKFAEVPYVPVKNVVMDRDVFGILAAPSAADGSGNPDIWLTERDTDPNYSKVFGANTADPLTQSDWQQCSGQSSDFVAGYFGVDRTPDVKTTFTRMIAFVPTSSGTKIASWPSTSCAVSNFAGTLPAANTVTSLATFKDSSSNSRVYYVKSNFPANDDVVMRKIGGGIWAPTGNIQYQSTGQKLRIYAVDGNDMADRVYVATNYGLYSCTGDSLIPGSGYPYCYSWNKVENHDFTSPDTQVTQVVYQFIPEITYGAKTTDERSRLIIGVNGTKNGFYVSVDEGRDWSTLVRPNLGEIISGITTDSQYIYVTSYGSYASNGVNATKVKALDPELYSPKSLIAGSCPPDAKSSLAGDVASGGLSVYKAYIREIDNLEPTHSSDIPEVVVKKITDYPFGNGTYGFDPSHIALGVSLLIDPTTCPAIAKVEGNSVASLYPYMCKAKRIYVWALGKQCNKNSGYVRFDLPKNW